QEWAAHNMQTRIEELYELVLIYGERSVFDPVAEYDFSTATAARTRYCGYVVNGYESEGRTENRWPPSILENGTRPYVLATAGGGEDGFLLLADFIRAAVEAP